MTKFETVLNEKNDLPSKDKPPDDKAGDQKPPDDKGGNQKPPDDKSITQEIIRHSIKNGEITVLLQLEITENGSTFVTLYKERKRKPIGK